MDAAVAAAGVGDAMAARVPGFPQLRASRFLASYSDAALGPREVDAWIDRSRREASRSLRKELYGRVQEAVAADCVYTSLWWLDDVVVLRKGFRGFRPFPGGEYTSLAAVEPEAVR